MKFIKKIITLYEKITSKYDPILSKISHDNIFAIAGQSAFFIILSSVPLSMFVVSLLQTLQIPIDLIETALKSVFTLQMVDEITDYLSSVYDSAVGISLISLVITLWSASQGINAITNGINRVYDAYENRNWLFRRIAAMIYTLVFFLLLLVSLFIIVLGSSLNDLLSPFLVLLPDFVGIIYNLRFIIFFIILMFLFAAIYRNFPNINKHTRKEYGIKYQLPGAFLCAASWFVLSFGISIYVDDFNGFSIYGGLTRLAVIMIWIYFCMVCLMICAEINYVYHAQIKAFSLKKLFRKINRKRK